MTDHIIATTGKPVLGLTGYPGSGKSTVARLLAQRGGAVVDADALARAAFDEQAVRDQLRKTFGPHVFHPDGTPNRSAIAKRIFSDADAKAKLEAIVHPRVAQGRADLHKQYAADPAVQFMVEDCPLLIETGLHDACDRVLLLDTPCELRLQRLAESRGWDAAELDRREANQADLATRRAHADAVLSNDGDTDALTTQLDALLAQWGWLPASKPDA